MENGKMELVVKIEGGLITNDNSKEYADDFRKFMSLQVASKMETDDDFKGGNEFIKQLKDTQDKIKIMKDKLVNGKAEEVMKILDDLNSEIASKKTEFKKEIDVRKEKIKYDIIVNAQQRYAQDCSNSVYKPKIADECNETFKGKSNFENMQKDADIICNKYINQCKADDKKKAEMTEAYRAVNFKYNKDDRADLIALAVETYFKQGKDADFVRIDLTNKYMEEEAEKKRLEEEQREKEEKEKENQVEPEQGDMLDKNDEIEAEIIQEKLQETLDNKGVECYNNSVEIPKKDTYFKVIYKEENDVVQFSILCGKCHRGDLAMTSKEFADFKCEFRANEYINLNENGENYAS